jgi:hypothetical protein
MPRIVRLPAHVAIGELRAYWDSTDEETGLFAAGETRAVRNIILEALGGRPLVAGSGNLVAAMQTDAVRVGNCAVDQLLGLGYDPATIVFSIMRSDAPPPTVIDPDDLRSKVEDLQARLAQLARMIGDVQEHKGVYILDLLDFDAVQDHVETCEATVAGLLDGLPAI